MCKFGDVVVVDDDQIGVIVTKDIQPCPLSTPKGWPKDRLYQLDTLQDMLWEMRNLNNDSHFLENVKQCIERAKSLVRHDINTGQESFIQFLTRKAHTYD